MAVFAWEDQNRLLRIVVRDVRIGADGDGGGRDDCRVHGGALPVHLGVVLHHLNPERAFFEFFSEFYISRTTQCS